MKHLRTHWHHTVYKWRKLSPRAKFTLFIFAVAFLPIIGYPIIRLIVRDRSDFIQRAFTNQFVSTNTSVGMKTSLEAKKNELTMAVSRGNARATFSMALSDGHATNDTSGVSYHFPTGTSVRYEPIPEGVKEEIILETPIGRNVLLSTLTVDNVVPQLTPENQIVFLDTNNEYAYHIRQPYAVDAAGAVTHGIRYRLTDYNDIYQTTKKAANSAYAYSQQLFGPIKTKPLSAKVTNQYALILELDPSWFSDPSRVYPITIDPTVVHDTSAEFATGQLDHVKDTGSGASPVLETTYQELNAEQHTVGLWHMNNAWTDASGNGLTGTAQGNATFTTSARVGSHAGSFDGLDDSVQIADNTYTSVTGPRLTLEAWVYLNAGETIGAIIHKGSHYSLYINSNQLSYADSVSYSYATNGSYGTIPNQTWTHLAVTYDGTNRYHYINGELVGIKNMPGSLTDNAIPLLIGCYDDSGTGGATCGDAQSFNGYIDEVHVLKRTKSPEEIHASASRRPSGTYTSSVIDLTSGTATLTTWNSLAWSELGVATGNGETLKDATNLVTQWNFNETSGTTATNNAGSCGASCNGTLTGFSATGSQDATAGSGWTDSNRRWGAGALMFDGVDDYIDVGNNSGLNITGSGSIEAWVRRSSGAVTSGYEMIISKPNGTNFQHNNYALALHATANKAYGVIGNGTTANIATSNTNIPYGTWNHIVTTWDGSNVKIYVNGILDGTTTQTITPAANAANLSIGKWTGYSGAGSYPLKGVLDSTRIYSRALTAAEILSNYNSGSLELQTRVGNDTTPDDGSWEAWRPTTSETAVDDMETFAPGGCTGGTLVDGGKVHQFTSSGTFECTGSGTVEVLVVAGGGGGGSDMGGGGGGGGVIHKKSYAISANTPVTVTVGGGGAGAPAGTGQVRGTDGQNSVFGTLTAIGGGGGASIHYTNTSPAGNGGSGGGASGAGSFGLGYGGVAGLGTSGQGYPGGIGNGQWYPGGGGGAGGPGSSAPAHGGIGYYSDILGQGYFWGGGGGGSGYTGSGGNGGHGGGGGGAIGITRGGSGLNQGAEGGGGCTVCQANTPGGSAGANTGGGGGGGGHYNGENNGGNGGSGIVIVRLSPLTKDTVIKSEGSTSQKLTTGKAQVDANTVALWHLDETGGTGAYITNSSSYAKKVFPYTGADQTYVVPAGVTSLNIKMWGGGGGSGNIGGWTYGYDGGGGGYTTGNLAVTPGQSITVMVGGGGTNGSIANQSPSYGGGARSCNAGVDCRYGGQGGGRSAIRISGTEYMTAGGGGGGGSSRATNGQAGGAGGGSSGGTGASYTAACGGGGGGQGAGGAGGVCANANGSAGTQFAGGNPAGQAYGGGGGGGYYGGGGGGYGEPNDMGGGGGGSGYIGGAGVSGASTTAGSGRIQANVTDADNGGAGRGGKSLNAMTNGANGRVVITANASLGHGTPTGTTVVDGISGKARSFNGSSDFILIPANPALDVQNLTIEAWVYAENFAQDGFVFEKTTNGSVNTQYSCFFAAAGTFYFRTYNTAATIDNLTLTTSAFFKNGAWNHIACTYDGANKSIYVNGVLAATKAYTEVLQTNPAGTAIIGAYGSGTSYFFNGKIDEVKVSNTGRSAEEIAETYRLGRDQYISKSITSTDLSSKIALPFLVAADRPGTYLQASAGESPYANNMPDANTVGLWHLDDNNSEYPRSCYVLLLRGVTTTGTYYIDPDGPGGNAPLQAYCNMTYDGGGWTMGVKSWYGSGMIGKSAAVGSVTDATTLMTNAYKLSDQTIRNIIGPSNNFDVMVDQNGYNSLYSTGNYEYVVIRNYTGLWTYEKAMPASTTTTTFQSYRASDHALAWTGNIICGYDAGYGASGINCWGGLGVTNNPQGGAGCTINMGTQSNAGWYHFFMNQYNDDTYLYICNGAQHSSGQSMNHRFWFRERQSPVAITKNAADNTTTNPSLITATGGTITKAGGYTIHTFTSSGTFTVTSGSDTVEALVIAGGGGGANTGSGGGAGGYIHNTAVPVTPQAYTITVGGGGAGGATTAAPGANGGNSVFSTLTAIGGGGGRSHGGCVGASGGSGSGGPISTSCTATGGAGTSGQGTSGGAGYLDVGWAGNSGGGGGAGGAGTAGGNTAGTGAGGWGKVNGISGAQVYYAGGGGGGEVNGSFVGAGVHGGGTAVIDAAGGNGTANTGGGGAGGSYNGNYFNGGNGGSGIVIIRYKNSAYMDANDGAVGGASLTEGKLGKARRFNGTNNYIHIGNPASLQITGALTVEAWINTTTSGSYIGAVGKMGSAGGQYGYLLRMSGVANAAEFGVSGTGSNYINAIGTSPINDGKWHHIVGVYVPSTSVQIYVDGVLQTTTTASVPASIYNTPASLTIGSTYSMPYPSEYFNGGIDEVRISSVARSADEIRQAYEGSIRSHPITIDFGGKLDSGNLISGSGDLSFTVDATYYGLSSKGTGLYLGDKIIVRENYNGTEYIAQGTVTSVTPSTGAVTIAAWDSGGTFPSGGFTANASVFKWQREYWNITEPLDSHLNATTNITLRVTDGNVGRSVWLDDFKAAGDYLSTPGGSTITSSTGNRYFQYRMIQHAFDEAVTAQLTSLTVDYQTNVAPSAPTSLQTESAVNPTNVIDSTPEFSAIYNDTDVGDIANKYRVQVDNNSDFSSVYWDSGAPGTSMTNCTAGNRCADISYGGPALVQGTMYYMRIAFFDDDGFTGDWSTETATFILNTTPTSPSLDLPIDGSVVSRTPVFKTTTTDPNTDYLRYKIEICTNLGMTLNCQTFDQTSSQTGWSNQNDQANTAYTSGTQAIYTVQTPLAASTTYYWRSYSIDPAGLNIWSATQGTPLSFTTTDGVEKFNIEGLNLEGLNFN